MTPKLRFIETGRLRKLARCQHVVSTGQHVYEKWLGVNRKANCSDRSASTAPDAVPPAPPSTAAWMMLANGPAVRRPLMSVALPPPSPLAPLSESLASLPPWCAISSLLTSRLLTSRLLTSLLLFRSSAERARANASPGTNRGPPRGPRGPRCTASMLFLIASNPSTVCVAVVPTAALPLRAAASPTGPLPPPESCRSRELADDEPAFDPRTCLSEAVVAERSGTLWATCTYLDASSPVRGRQRQRPPRAHA
jgi:hypothetical protein